MNDHGERLFGFEVLATVDAGAVRREPADEAMADAVLPLALVIDVSPTPLTQVRAASRASEAFLERFRHARVTSWAEAQSRLTNACVSALVGGAEHLSGLAALTFWGRQALFAASGSVRVFRQRGETLTRLGIDAPSTMATGIEPCEPGDTYLLCSDGVWAAMDTSAIGGVLRRAPDLANACGQLTSAASAAGGLDSAALAMVRLRPREVSLSPAGYADDSRESAAPTEAETRRRDQG